jgi:anhydro-N-acetylmuramic acid kinase
MKQQSMIVAGVMSGTSADGINVALVRFGGEAVAKSRKSSSPLPFELLGHAEYSYPPKVRVAVLAAMNSSSAKVADLARLNFLLGELYAEAVSKTARQFQAKIDLVGCHGQTIYHQGAPTLFLGRKVAATWQTGEGAVVAARVGAPVVSDFRPADMAAQGKGAPLVPFLDYLLFRDQHLGRIVQNIGGIANLTAIPAGASASDLLAFDTGPGNMVIDAVTDKLFHQPFDRDGKIAATGNPLEPVLQKILQLDFLRSKPPKTAGREEFGREFVRQFLRLCGRARKQDIVATATALTARSIRDAIQKFLLKKNTVVRYHELILSGGGAKNPTLVNMLVVELKLLDIQIRFSDEFGIPSEAKEAIAFAALAYETWHRRPSNIPSATGARQTVVLGKISYP